MNIYFSGIGGVGLGPLAQMAVDAGHTVIGSDLAKSLTTSELSQQGVQLHIGEQTGEYLREIHSATPIDWLVYTAALPIDHPELVAARKLGIHATKRDGLLEKLIADSEQKLIAVSGTHGKTTVTGMLVWVLEQLGVPISYSIGSQISFGPSGKFNPDADYFVYECDEFDRNFLKFHPHLSIIVSADYDHPDTYPTEEEYKAAFRQFIEQSDHTILWQQDADYIDFTGNDSSWVLQPHEVLPLKIAGEHNRRNATLVAKAIEKLSSATSTAVFEDSDFPSAPSGPEKKDDIEVQTVAEVLESFPGTIRRFEKLAPNLYSDYGHHPAEITATLQMAREIADYVVLIYQPHQNIRQHEIRSQYTDDIFKNADEIYWLPTYLSREDPALETLTPTQLTAQLTLGNLHISEFDDTLQSKITRHRNAGHLVLGMGAGSIDGWLRKH
ncbi:MAG: Mur ligase domain-containing protein [Candidatus Saccharimonadales bacterium]